MGRARVAWMACLLLSIGCSVDPVDPASDDDAASDGEEPRDGASEPSADADVEDAMDASAPDSSMDAGDAGTAPGADACTACDGSCVDTQSDPAHCGGCNSPCRGTCRAGRCERSCQPGLYVVADLSNSMAQQLRVRDAGPSDAGSDAGDATVINPNTRIEGMKSALLGFLDDPATAELQLGLGHFPIERPDAGGCDAGDACSSTTGVGCCPSGNLCFPGIGCLPVGGATSSCEAADYAKPDIELGAASSVGPALRTTIAGFKSFGQSPEIPALEGALSYARSKADASRKLSVVLFADGMWTTCGVGDAGMGSTQPMAEVAARFASGSPAVTTYVLGIQGDADAGFFDPVAAAGGTGKAYNAASAGEIGVALRAIRDHAAAQCP